MKKSKTLIHRTDPSCDPSWVLVIFLLMTGCGKSDSEKVERMDSSVSANENAVVQTVTLTVAEGKRLIAKGLAKYAPVCEKMDNGIVIVTRGSSNTYLAEELLQTNLIHGAFLTGRIQPAGSSPLSPQGDRIGEFVIRNGVHEPETKFIEGLRAMQPGDIVFKGANLVNYEDRKAAVCIGHPTGGTMGMFLPFVEEKGVRLIIPVGLEKQTSQDLEETFHLFLHLL